jgi:hypothetical protein
MGTNVTADPVVKYGTIGAFSGPIVRGTMDAFTQLPTMTVPHIDRAFWLTTMVESGGKAGSIMAADGTGMTASLEQLVAVLPRHMDEQGSLFGMLQELTTFVNILDFLPFDKAGWQLVNGVLQDAQSGKPVPPKQIRDTFTPIEGHVPVNGPRWEQSKKWAIAFHHLFAAPSTLQPQISYGIQQFIKYGNTHSPRLNKKSVNELVYTGRLTHDDPFDGATVNDLAMSVWWSYKVNGPTPALERLQDAATAHKPDDPEFGRHLISLLRTSQYGRWATNRYDRTRQNAMKVWPAKFFDGPDAAMPARR